MHNKKIYTIAESRITNPITFNLEICIGCNKCIEICQIDVFIPNPEKTKPPIMLYPEECWYCGSCVAECPKPGAIKLNIPLMNRVHWKRKKEDKTI